MGHFEVVKSTEPLEEKFKRNISLVNLGAWREYFSASSSSEAFDRILRFSQDNRETFEKVFGKHEGIFRHEYNQYYWRVALNGYLFTIFSGKKGTAYEVALPEGMSFEEALEDNSLQEAVKEFFFKLEEVLEPKKTVKKRCR